MSNITQPEFSKPLVPPSGMRGEIEQKWGKFSAQEITALKDKDDLVAGLQAKYQLDKTQAQRDVDAFANGRQL
jgi:hypothetical protein